MTMRALIVDDSPAAQSIARFALDDALAQLDILLDIISVSGGIAALREIAKGDIGLLLCDLHMPDIHGLEVLQFWKKNKPKEGLAFIVTTQVSIRDREKAEALGASGFLAKPLTGMGLATSLKKFRVEKPRGDDP